MVTFLSILLSLTSLGMIVLVLLHKGKGGGLSNMFGGGVSSSLGGSAVVEKNLDRLTVIVATCSASDSAFASDAPAAPRGGRVPELPSRKARITERS